MGNFLEKRVEWIMILALKENIKKSRLIIRKMGLVRGSKVILHSVIKKFYFYVIPRVARLFAGNVNDNLIVFDSVSFSDNAKVLSDYILNNKNNKYKIIWFLDDIKGFKSQENIKFIRRTYLNGSGFKYVYSIKAFYYGLKAKYVFYTHALSWVGAKNKDQVIINLWHGTGYKAARVIGSEAIFDYMIVPGELFVKSKAKFFKCDENKIIPLGYSRYDLFNNNITENTKLFLKENIGIENNQKLIIWLPTFISDGDLLKYKNPLSYIFSGMPLIESVKQLIDLDIFCSSNNIKLLIKKHRYKHQNVPLYKHLERLNLKSLIILSDDEFAKEQIELYDLLPFTDALISDVSSVSVDYLLLDKPVAYTVNILEDYKNTRGFVFDDPSEYMPGSHVNNLDELKIFIADVSSGVDRHRKRRNDMLKIMHNKTTNYCERITDFFGI